MGIREWTNRHPVPTACLVGVVLAGCVGTIVAEVMANRHPIGPTIASHYFTIDDGKTYFTASENNIPPFDYQGKTAVRAYVFECAGTKFVGYLERYKPETQKIAIAGAGLSPDQQINGREMKKPGDATWVSSSDHNRIGQIISVNCPGGLRDTPNPLEP